MDGWDNDFYRCLTYVAEKLAENGIGLIIPKPNQVIQIAEVAKNNFFEENNFAIDFWKIEAHGKEIKDHSNKNNQPKKSS